MVTVEEIASKIFKLQSKKALLNATVIESEDCLLVIDTFLFPDDSKELLSFCKKLNKPVKYIINSHWHSDHCYGNRFFDEFNPIIIAHDNYYKTIASEKNMLIPSRKSIVEKKHLRSPNITFANNLRIDEFDINCFWTHGHSSDSIAIFKKDVKLIWTGDNVLNSNDDKIAIPYFYWGDGIKHLEALKYISGLDVKNIVSGHGSLSSMVKIKADIVYLENIIKQFKLNRESKDLYQTVTAESCYPNSSNRQFWVAEMHKLNLDNLVINS